MGLRRNDKTKKLLSDGKVGSKNPSYGRKSEFSFHWKGGKINFGTDGKYAYILNSSHPDAIKLGYIAEHRLVMEKHLGRPLFSNEVVHHINGNTKDNCIENLMIFENNGGHIKHHWMTGSYKERSKKHNAVNF